MRFASWGRKGMTRFERSLIITIGLLCLTTQGHASLSNLVSESAMAGYVVAERDVESTEQPGDTASVRVTIGSGSTSKRLQQRVERFGRGRSAARVLNRSQEVLY